MAFGNFNPETAPSFPPSEGKVEDEMALLEATRGDRHVKGVQSVPEEAPGQPAANPQQAKKPKDNRKGPPNQRPAGSKLAGTSGNGSGTGNTTKVIRTHTLSEIVAMDFPALEPVIKGLLDPGELSLFVARQKEGKSTLSLQLAIDVSCGTSFLNRFPVAKGTVLYVDYENRLYRLKQRGMDLLNGRTADGLHIKAYERLSERDVGLLEKTEFENLKALVEQIKPGLLILDPLRYAAYRELDLNNSVTLIERVAELRRYNSDMATILVHHLKKTQQEGMAVHLRKDPRAWIEKAYGSQALLAHVDTIWGLEEYGDGYTFATVPRSQEPVILRLEKEPTSERFLLSADQAKDSFTSAEKGAWDQLPDEFSWSEATHLGIANSTLDRTIRRAKSVGLLEHDPQTRRYKKAG